MHQQGEADGQDDTLLDPPEDHDHGGDHRHPELPGPLDMDPPHPVDVHQFHADHEDHRRQHRLGQVGQGGGEEQQHQEDDAGRHQLGQLAPAAGAFDHLGLGRAAVDHEGAGKPCPQVGETQSDEIHVLVEPFVMADGIGA